MLLILLAVVVVEEVVVVIVVAVVVVIVAAAAVSILTVKSLCHSIPYDMQFKDIFEITSYPMLKVVNSSDF